MTSSKKPLPEALRALVGRSVGDVDTPALVVDLDAMERNLTRMADFARKHGVRLRPHAKMHKCAALARLQMQAGAVGICVQKTAEAEIMAEHGVRDIYISNQVVSPAKLVRVAALAQRLHAGGGRLAIAVDSVEGARGLGRAVAGLVLDAAEARAGRGLMDVFVEIDVGQGRCGAVPGDAAVAVAREVAAQPGLRLAGLQAYHGRAQHLRTAQQRRDAIAVALDDVQFTCKRLVQAGLDAALVTGAGTGTFALEAASGVWGEIQPGSFLFMDADYARNERDPAQPPFEHALFVRSQVISRSSGHAVCDAGHKAHAIDSGLPLVHGADLQFANGGDEHGVLHGPDLPALGATVWLIPGHCDPTVNLHDFMIGVRGGLSSGRVERILRVDTRGALT